MEGLNLKCHKMDWIWTTNKHLTVRSHLSCCQIKTQANRWQLFRGDSSNSRETRGLQAMLDSALKTGLIDSSSCLNFKSKGLPAARGVSPEWVVVWISSSDKFITTPLLPWILLNFKKNLKEEQRLKGFKWKISKLTRRKWKLTRRPRKDRRGHQELIHPLCNWIARILCSSHLLKTSRFRLESKVQGKK